MKAYKLWDVILEGRLIDKVFFDSRYDVECVRCSLVEYNGYDARIAVMESAII